MLVLVAICALIWAIDNQRWTREAWHLPTVYNGDAHEILARIQASSEGELLPFRPQRVERLGAPFGADWSAYPTPEKIQLHLLGLIARATDVFFAANCGLALAFGLSAAAFYWVLRCWLWARWEWAAAGAILFSFNYAIYHRGLSHFSFALVWVVPLGLLACTLVARSRRLAWGNVGMWTCFVAGAALGCHNTYYLFFWLPLMGWALLAQVTGPRRRVNLGIGTATIGIALASFVASNLEYWIYSTSSDARPLLERNYGGTELYALKAVELFIPPSVHRFDALSFFGQRYFRWSEMRGEGYLPYLGLVGIAGLVWLVWHSVPRLLRGARLSNAALTTGWLVAFGAAGGVMSFFAFFGGFFVFRATNRIGVYIAAVVLAYLVMQLSRRTRAWPAWARGVAALAVACFGLLDQLPRSSAAKREEIARTVASDRKFGAELERFLPAGAAVFQLPVLPFPEVKPPWRLNDYEHFRPYLATHTLRFSYGALKFRPRVRWQQEVETLPPAELARRLERLGFAALYVNRRGFEDSADTLLRGLAAAGYEERIVSPLGSQVVVRLRPSATAELPLASTFTYGRGWQNRTVNGVRWAFEPASLLYYNPLPHPVRVALTVQVHAPDSRLVTLSQEGKLLTRVRAVADVPTPAKASTQFAPGLNVVVLDGGEGVRNERTSGQLRTLGVEFASVQVLDAPTPAKSTPPRPPGT